MSGVFISYRRGDAAASAGRLSDHLKARLGPGLVSQGGWGTVQEGVPSGKVLLTHPGA